MMMLKMGDLYYEVAFIIDKTIKRERGIRPLVYESHYANKKMLLRLCAETLKYRSVFDGLLEDEELGALIDDPSVGGDINLLYVFLYEFLVGTGIKDLPKDAARMMTRHANAIHRGETRLDNEGRGVDSVKKENEKKEQSIVMPRYARINTLKWREEEALKALEDEEWKIVRLSETDSFIDCIRQQKNDEVIVDPHVALLLLFPFDNNFHSYWMVQEGLIILQDKASCLPAFLLDPPPTSHVIDACAAPGMKTSHLSAILANEGRIFAFDRDYGRVNTMNQMLKSAGVTNAVVENGDFLRINLEDRQYSEVEYALVDPPCSGSGIVKRMDEWIGGGKDKTRLAKLANLQAMLLKQAMGIPSMKRVVYSTCSVHEEENEAVVNEVLEDVPSFHVVQGILPQWKERGKGNYPFASHCIRADPSKTATNGFFVAVFERIEEGEMKTKKKKNKKKTERLEDNETQDEEQPKAQGKKKRFDDDEEISSEEPKKKKKKKINVQ